MMTFKAIDRRLEGKTLLRQCQLAELYLLDVFVEICEKHNLQYCLGGGTLIGAMRHNGFIPWDDDIDIGMPVKDYKKFLQVAPNEVPDNLLVQVPGEIPGTMEGFAKLMDRSSFFCLRHSRAEVPSGIYIDIFPYIKYPEFPSRVEKIVTRWSSMAWIGIQIHKNLAHGAILGILVSFAKAVVWSAIYHGIVLFTQVSRLFLPTILHDHWSVIPVGRGNSSGPESIFFPPKKHIFEGKEYSVPNDPDAVLTRHYGDWRTIPPPEKRVWHSSIICPTQAPDAPWARKYKRTEA